MPKKSKEEVEKSEDVEEETQESQDADEGSQDADEGSQDADEGSQESGEESGEEDPDEKPAKKSSKKSAKKPEQEDDDKSFEEIKMKPEHVKKIIGEFPELQKNYVISSEFGYILKASTLFFMDKKQVEMNKQHVGSHQMKNIKANTGMPPLSSNATQFETLGDFTDSRSKVKSGSQKLFNTNTRPVNLCLETFASFLMNEYSQNFDAKDFKALYEKLSKDKNSILGTVLKFAHNNPKCDMTDDYGSTKKIDEIFENYASDTKTRGHVVNSIVRYLKFLGYMFAHSISINKRSITFKTMFDMISITLQSNGYVMDPRTELAFMLYAENRARAIVKKLKEAKLLSGKGKKVKVGKKMTEKDRALNIKKARSTKKTTRK